jgi:hypothetical protein
VSELSFLSVLSCFISPPLMHALCHMRALRWKDAAVVAMLQKMQQDHSFVGAGTPDDVWETIALAQ